MPDPSQFIPLSEAKQPLFVGIDLGGTNIKLGLTDDRGHTLAYRTVPTEADQGAKAACQRMATEIDQLLVDAGATKDQVARVGLATPGPIDIEEGILLTPGNLPKWWNFPLRNRVSELSGLPARYSNDANAAAFGEFWRGAGKEVHSMVLFTLGTGVGGGIVIGDVLVEGVHSCGSECGHILIDPSPDARKDSLGNTGSLESYCGSYGVTGRAQDAMEAGRQSSLAEIAKSRELEPLDIAEAAEAGDELARQVVMDTAYYLGLGIVTLVHVIDPNNIVLGGAMTFGGAGHPLGDAFLQKVIDTAKPRILPPLQETLRIEFAQLGGDAGYIGSAGLARLEHIRKG